MILILVLNSGVLWVKWKGLTFDQGATFKKSSRPLPPSLFTQDQAPGNSSKKLKALTFQRSGHFSWSWPNFKDKHLFYLDHDFEVLEHFSFRAPSFSHFHTWHKPNPSLSKSALKIKKTLAITKPKKDIYTHSHSYPLYSLSNYITKNIKISLIKGLQSN